MKLCDAWSDQLRRPHGRMAPLIGRLLNRANAAFIQHAVEVGHVEPTHRVLDIGFGGGVSLALLLECASQGLVAGVDISGEMVERARRRHAADVRAGRLSVEQAPAEALPFPDGRFDRVLAIHTVYFWPDRHAGLREAHRVLEPGGRLVLGVFRKELQQAAAARLPGMPVFGEDEAAEAMAEAGFGELAVTRFTTPRGRSAVIVAATRPAVALAN